MITIAEHTIEESLLTPGGIVLDVGCRGFAFAIECAIKFKSRVIAFDIEDVRLTGGAFDFETKKNLIEFHQLAVSNNSFDSYYVETADQQAKYLSHLQPHKSEQLKPVRVISINEVYARYCSLIDNCNIDCLKLDCEGSEYDILSAPDFKPVPKQISVEFHAHCHPKVHDQKFAQCLGNLLKWYEPIKHERTQAHGAGYNYWDSLFIRKDLI